MKRKVKIYNCEDFGKLLDGVRLLGSDETSTDTSDIPEDFLPGQIFCSTCKAPFANLEEFRNHFKTEWHRYNLKRGLAQQLHVSEEAFNSQKDESSESEEEENSDPISYENGKLFLKNSTGQVFSIYYNLLFDSKDYQLSSSDVSAALIELKENNFWTIIMLSGGHFAAAIYKGSEVIVHRTKHFYTVRAKQGGSQSAKDASSSGRTAKSAGSTLRRQNEEALIKEVRDTLKLWSDDLERSKLIMVRAAGPFNQSVLFGGKIPVLSKSDKRIRFVPFSTRRATYKEVGRIFEILSTVEVFDSEQQLEQSSLKVKSPKKVKEKPKKPLQGDDLVKPQQTEEPSEEDDTDDLIAEDQEIDFSSRLKEFDSDAPKRPKKPRKKKPKPKKQSEKELALEKMFAACKIGDVKALQEITLSCKLEPEAQNEMGNTLLHVAAVGGYTKAVLYLMENGCDPSVRNSDNQTVYSFGSENIRKIMEVFAFKNPDKFDYDSAGIPLMESPDGLEREEKAKARKKFKRDKIKEKKKEEGEKETFLSLTDNEKKNLAVNQVKAIVVKKRCFLCAKDMTSLVPFEYNDNKFCSIGCLKQHRSQTSGT